MKFLIENIRKHVRLTDEEAQRVFAFFEPTLLNPKTRISEPGRVCSISCFIEKGIMRSYYLDENGQEHIVNFGSPGWWITDMFSFLSGNTSDLYIEANEEVQGLLLTRERQLQLFDEIPAVERYFRILTENALVANQLRVRDTLSETAEQRYTHFLTKYSAITNCLPQKQIASYIGVTPEFFSKMKARLNRK